MNTNSLPKSRILLLIGSLFVLLSFFIYIFAFSPFSPKFLNEESINPVITSPTNPTPLSLTKPLNPFALAKVDLVPSLASLSPIACGANLTITYTAIFYTLQNSQGGTIQFLYTTTNGRGSTHASLTFLAGETMKIYTFTAKGTVKTDNTFPGIAEVLVSTPTQIHSPQVAIPGTCH